MNTESVSNEELTLRKNTTALAKDIGISKRNHDNYERIEALIKKTISRGKRFS